MTFNIRKPLFKKPRWLKPEINEPLYYVHIAVLVIVGLYLLKVLFNHDMFNLDMGWKVGLVLIAGDIVAHTILKLD